MKRQEYVDAYVLYTEAVATTKDKSYLIKFKLNLMKHSPDFRNKMKIPKAHVTLHEIFSLLNHSCNPNSETVCIGGTIAVFTCAIYFLEKNLLSLTAII